MAPARSTDVTSEPGRPGVRTSEFWLSAGVIVCATVLVALGRLDADMWALVSIGGSGAYGVSRGLAKRR